MSKAKKPTWISSDCNKYFKDFVDTMESKGIEAADYKLMAAFFAVEFNEYVNSIKDINANGQVITTKGSNGYPVTKQNPAVQTKQAAFKNLLEIIKQSGLSPKAAKDIQGKEKDDNEALKFLRGE